MTPAPTSPAPPPRTADTTSGRRAPKNPARTAPAVSDPTQGTPEHGEPLLVDKRGAARLLSISERKLWELTNRREIPHVRIGKSVRYAPADLREWVDTIRIQARK